MKSRSYLLYIYCKSDMRVFQVKKLNKLFYVQVYKIFQYSLHLFMGEIFLFLWIIAQNSEFNGFTRRASSSQSRKIRYFTLFPFKAWTLFTLLQSSILLNHWTTVLRQVILGRWEFLSSTYNLQPIWQFNEHSTDVMANFWT